MVTPTSRAFTCDVAVATYTRSLEKCVVIWSTIYVCMQNVIGIYLANVLCAISFSASQSAHWYCDTWYINIFFIKQCFAFMKKLNINETPEYFLISCIGRANTKKLTKGENGMGGEEGRIHAFVNCLRHLGTVTTNSITSLPLSCASSRSSSSLAFFPSPAPRSAFQWLRLPNPGLASFLCVSFTLHRQHSIIPSPLNAGKTCAFG